MKARTALLVMLFAVPSVLAWSPFAPSADPAIGAASADPDGCITQSAAYSCEWSFDTMQDPPSAKPAREFQVPAFNKTLATITVQLEGQDRGWRITLSVPGANNSDDSYTEHPAGGTPAPYTSESTTHVLLGHSGYRLVFAESDYGVAGQSVAGVGPGSTGKFRIIYEAHELPIGVAPTRPAASRDYPQITDIRRDARRPEFDIVAAWIDEPSLNDGLIAVHMAVDNLSSVALGAPAVPGAQADSATWNVHFKVHGVRYVVTWFWFSSSNKGCQLFREAVVVSKPACVFDVTHSTLDALVPIAGIGNPGDGERFEELAANVDTTYRGIYANAEDNATSRFAFALGGPVVWDSLNNCHFCPAAVHWWEDPLSSDNLPNTVQVGGGAIAIIGFFGGLLLLRRRRQKVRALLREIEAAEVAHERDTRAALLALGALDSKFADMYHKGELNDDQYQVVAQRLATAATRFALRQGLGLDDGAAGDRAFVTVPVRAGIEEEVQRS